MQDGRISDGLHYRSLKDLWEEWIFVWSIISTDHAVQSFCFGEHVVCQTYMCGEREIVGGYGKLFGVVDGSIERKLDTLNQVEGDRIFEPAGRVSMN